jgi:acetoin utilization deacetylase AcuC-like enzyme
MSTYNPITLITHPRYLDHDTGGDHHPEIPQRLVAITETLRASPLASVIREAAPREPERNWLTNFHGSSYLFRFEEEALTGKSYLGHPDNRMCYDSYAVALLAAGAGPTGIDLLENNKSDLIFCSIRPPGHHADRSMAMGFCFLNNAVIAARYWQQTYGRRHILIIDWDAHHGNGIQAAFDEDPDIFYISIHEHPTFSYPGTGFAEETGIGAGVGTTLNIPLPPGADDTAVLTAIKERIGPAVDAFQPQAILVAAGFDGHRLDDMSGLAYSTELYGHLGEIIAAWAKKYCGGKVISLLEGGYHIEALAASVEKYLAGLAKKN